LQRSTAALLQIPLQTAPQRGREKVSRQIDFE